MSSNQTDNSRYTQNGDETLTYDRAEISEAFAHFVAVGDSGDWNAWADLHTVDGVWNECHLGRFEGREAIRQAITSVMAQAPAEMYFPVDWSMIEGNRVVFYPAQCLPDPMGGDTVYRFGCVTILEYGGGGQWSYQEDVYNPNDGQRVFEQWIKAGGKLPTD